MASRPALVHGFRLPEVYRPARSTTNPTQLRRPLGHGAFGVVIAAHDTELDVDVAIKRVPVEAGRERGLLRELRLLLHFKHDNLLGLHDVLLVENESPNKLPDVYFVFPRMDTDLHYVIHNKGQTLSTDHVAYFVYQILRGVSACHRAGVLHRDLKPNNLLVNADCNLKICDFGLGRGLPEPPNSPALKPGTRLAGKPMARQMTATVVTRWYRAPELLLQTSNSPFDEGATYGPPVDLWSVGCIFAELLGRHALFPGKDELNQRELIVGALGVPADLSGIEKAIENPVQRADSLTWLESMRGKPLGQPLGSRFPQATPDAINLLEKLLRFDPSCRITAVEALRHPFLSGLYDAERDEEGLERLPASIETLKDEEVRGVLYNDIRSFQRGIDRKGTPDTPIVPPTPPTPDISDQGSKRQRPEAELERSTARRRSERLSKDALEQGLTPATYTAAQMETMAMHTL